MRCSGSKCYATLRHVTLKQCRLEPCDGATVDIFGLKAYRQTAAEASASVSAPRYAIFAWGSGTLVNATDIYTDSGVLVNCSASFTATRLHVSVLGGCTDAAVSEGEGSLLNLNDSMLKLGPGMTASGRLGVAGLDKGRVVMSACTVSGLGTAVGVWGGGHATLRNCIVDGEMTGLQVSGSGGKHSRIDAESCTVRGKREAVYASQSGRISFHHCDVGKVVRF